MDEFDLIVIGTGAGLNVASQARRQGLQVAVVDRGPAGGTCLNHGCVPSKMLIYPADAVRSLQDARAVGVHASIDEIDFGRIMSRMRSVVDKTRTDLEKSLRSKETLTYFAERAAFVSDYTLELSGGAGQAGGEEGGSSERSRRTITAPKIVLATGARPLVPPIPGLEEAGFLDNSSLLQIQRLPASLIIIGGGYIGCEFSHFFSAMGADVVMIGRGPQLLKGEDPEAAGLVRRLLAQYMRVITEHEVISVEVGKDGMKIVNARNVRDGKVSRFEAEEILLAAGRRSNSDLLHPERGGIETDRHGWIIVDEYLQTSKKGVYALGDAIGKHMFRHTANYESEVVAHNLLRAGDGEREAADYHAVPYAVFTHPQVAGVGMKEHEALAEGRKVLIGRAGYMDTAMGVAMGAEHAFVKVVLEEESGRILGATAVGPMAAELVQQVVYLMNTDYQDMMPVIRSQVIHPTINEVLVRAFSELSHPGQQNAAQ
jgi:dihydrolipoamide dehydrogenase